MTDSPNQNSTTGNEDWTICYHASGGEPGCAACWYGATMRANAEIERLKALCQAHEVDPEGCLECFMAEVEGRDPKPLPHGIDP